MFDRLLKIITEEELNKIKKLNILIIGIGGVGGYALEALVRSGVENITIVDGDVIDISNLNRQIISLNSNIGKSKVDVALSRCMDINKDINIKTINKFIDKNNIEELFKEKYDFIIDACDTMATKMLLIKYAINNNIKIISSMGTGNRFKPECITITTLDKTHNDPVAKVMRKLLKDEKIALKIPVVWSSEVPKKINDRTPGSLVTVPAVAGIYLASYIIQKTIIK